MTKKQFKKILIANRGEIALRVMKTCREMDIATVSLYTDKEINLPHATAADEAICLGEGSLADTYLNMDLIIEKALALGVDAIHPGYGFLSENPEFARRLAKTSITLIGPSADVMDLMGRKMASKVAMDKIGIPLIPGYHGTDQSPELLRSEASKIGYPLLIKASAGGGGKGMRVVNSEEEFSSSLESAKREAQNAFGDDIVLLEKYITKPRHIEVQVMGDGQGGAIHLFERECSIQRRHQKIVEESPSPALSEQKRNEICEAAVKIAQGIKYAGAGTVEFIYDIDDSFYFLEMNTRLQVEHPITELVTGVDLVRMQIEVAQGEGIKHSQDQISQRGHAIEVRIYAEDPDNQFMPSIGKIHKIGETQLNNVRLDCGYRDGNEVTIDFDPMLAKLIAWGENREVATRKLITAFSDFPFYGLTTNNSYLMRILKSKPYIEGSTFTHFVEEHKEPLELKKLSDNELADIIALALTSKQASQAKTSIQSNTSAWSSVGPIRFCE